jgi:pimeloyl-ACP methyl ester carboxylesterase
MGLIPVGSAERFVAVDGGQVRLLTSTQHPGPQARQLLLVHGGGSDSSAISWYELFEALGREHRLVAVDLPGFGATTVPPVGGAEDMADFVARTVDRVGISRAVGVGVSMGGDVALHLALQHPALVEALVLIAPGGLVPVFRNRAVNLAAWLGAQLPDVLLRPLARLANQYADGAVRAMVKHPERLPPEVLVEFAREARKPDAWMGYARYNQASLGPWSMRNNLLPQVHRIEVPTLFFHGADDQLVNPVGSIRAATELMPAARVVLVPDCGHWAQLEARDRFLFELRAFLAST